MNAQELRAELLRHVRVRYPAIEVEVVPYAKDRSRIEVRFLEPSFSGLYVRQRYHILRHLIPSELYERELSNSVWLELAPGEKPEDLRSGDDELIEELAPAVLEVLVKQGAFDELKQRLSPGGWEQPSDKCAGDFRHMRRVLEELGHDQQAQFDAFHVLMARGGFCDCEILLNAAP